MQEDGSYRKQQEKIVSHYAAEVGVERAYHYHELPKVTFWLWGLPR